MPNVTVHPFDGGVDGGDRYCHLCNLPKANRYHRVEGGSYVTLLQPDGTWMEWFTTAEGIEPTFTELFGEPATIRKDLN